MRNHGIYGSDRKVSGEFIIPAGARAIIIGDRGVASPVMPGQAVLNIRKELISHLNEYPHTDEFLEELLSCVAARLEARRRARGREEGFTIPMGRTWVVTDRESVWNDLGVRA